MRKQVGRKTPIWLTKGVQIWGFFGVLFATLIFSTVVGTQSVHAAACTSAQCQTARGYAAFICQNHGGVNYFECPYSGENDDYVVDCNDVYSEQNDCSSVTNPS